jgi:Uma2 family endonuclease
LNQADLSTEPDGTFVSYDTLRSERLRLLEGQAGGYVELVGTPDMVLEVVSTNSVRKDTKVLRRLYWEASIPEYWLVDARGPALSFNVLRRRPRGYTATRGQGGWLRSEVFGRSFHFSRQTDPLGHPQYTLASRP